MHDKETFSNQANNLRLKAEEKVLAETTLILEKIKSQLPEEIQQMFHELLVHQIELEMQNEDLKRMELELVASRDLYLNFYDLSPVGYFTLSEQGLILETNLTAASLLGVHRRELVKQPISQFIFNKDQDIYYLHSNQLFETDKPLTCELRMVKKNNASFWTRLESKVVRNVNGNPVIRIVMRDVTERKQAEDALIIEKKFSEAIIESIPGMLYVYDDQGNHIRHNIRHEEMTGYSAEELSHLNPLSWYDDKADIRRVEAAINDVFTKGHGEVEVPMRIKNGEKLMMHFTGSRLVMNGKNFIVGVGTDITDLKRAEAEKAELESQNRQLQKAESLGRMAGAIAHHFNNQLQVVTGNLELAAMSRSIGSDVVRNLNEAMEASRRAAEMSSMMLTYLWQTHVKHVLLDLSNTCLFGLSMLRAIIPNTIMVEPDLASPGPIIRANTNQMHQILTNLITNAWEAFGEKKGAIGLSIKTVSHAEIPASKRFPIDWQPQGISYACLEVSDTGCGIAETDIEKIFDPFFSTKFTGRGLGLPVVLGIVGAHGGGVTVESNPGRNSIFRIFLPVLNEDVSISPEKTVNAPEIEMNGTVLVVEDEAQVRDIVKMMLMSLGFTVLEAGDGVEALEIFQQHRGEICCVLSDLTMPRMDGWETLAALRQITPFIPVILSSGYDEAQVMAGEHPERPNAFLGKPFDIKRLSNAIRHAAYGLDWHG